MEERSNSEAEIKGIRGPKCEADWGGQLHIVRAHCWEMACLVAFGTRSLAYLKGPMQGKQIRSLGL